MTIVSVGLDLAKNVFAIHGVDESGKPALVRPSVPCAKLIELIASLPPCLIGMKVCSGINRIRGLLADFGLVFPQKPETLRQPLPDVMPKML